MNERIKQLADEAMVTLPAIEGSLSHTYFDKEKFAELIVKECGNVAWKCGSEFINNEIKRHFGVEE